MPAELIVVGAASYKASIGYGDLYNLQVREVVAGKLDAPNIKLTILAGDKERSSFLSSHLAPDEVEIEFAPVAKNEPYTTAPVSGFVDDDRTSWEIRAMRERHKEER